MILIGMTVECMFVCGWDLAEPQWKEFEKCYLNGYIKINVLTSEPRTASKRQMPL